MNFSLLKPRVLPARTDKYRVLAPGETWQWVLRERRPSHGPMALDFETRGLPLDKFKGSESYPVGVALADARGAVYIPFGPPKEHEGGIWNDETYLQVMQLLAKLQIPLIAHNVPFDGLWPMRDLAHLQLNWLACTLATYKLCATEGEFNQRWGLKDAMQDCLGWAETNEAGIDQWLVDHGHTRSVFKDSGSGRYTAHLASQEAGEGRWATPDKAEMWRCPPKVLGPYACADADACWLLWTGILGPLLKEYPVLQEYILEWYPPYMRLLMEQTLRGVSINTPLAGVMRAGVQREALRLEAELLASPSVAPHNEAWGHRLAMEARGGEPARLKKDGQVSKVWLKWQARVEAARSTQLNLSSGDQLRWLLYDKLGHPVLARTDGGLPATDEGSLKSMGEVGAALLELQDKKKLGQFYTQTLSLADSAGIIRPSFRVPGTVTGRLSGKEPNIQQMPNVVEFLSIWRARPGFRIVAVDMTSLENYVLTELSRDPALLKLYGPDAREGQDAYLFNAANLPGVGPKIRATGYDPDAATAADTAKAKKACKAERAVGKVFTLSANYGAGPRKIQETLRLQAGQTIPLEQVEEMHRGFWTLYAGIREYERELGRQWRKNSGWVLNGIGRPIGVCEEKRKDLVNCVCQSTGHDLLVKLINLTAAALNAAGIEWAPWIMDLHDASYVEVREDQAEAALDIMQRQAYDSLNEWAGGLIALKGTGKVLSNWGEAVGD